MKKPTHVHPIRPDYERFLSKGGSVPNSVQYWYCHESESASWVEGGPVMAKVSGSVSESPARKASKTTEMLKLAAKPSV
jgi:hypothetical protein